MKKLITMLVLMVIVSVSFGNITNDIENAKLLFKNKETWPDAENAFRQIVIDYPDADSVTLFNSMIWLSRAVGYQRKHSEFIEVVRTAISNYPSISPHSLAHAQISIGKTINIYFRNYDSAIAEYQKAIDNYPTVNSDVIILAKKGIAECLMKQKKYSEAQTVYQNMLIDYSGVNANSLADIQTRLADCIRLQGQPSSAEYLKISEYGDTKTLRKSALTAGQYMTVDDYITYLTKVLMIVPAIDENADFLGKIKSKLELLK